MRKSHRHVIITVNLTLPYMVSYTIFYRSFFSYLSNSS
ncbi:hypothetical protein [Magpiepox virus 2]|nr:hypothetical protein [Magpiepox virus 2]